MRKAFTLIAAAAVLALGVWAGAATTDSAPLADDSAPIVVHGHGGFEWG